MHSLWQSDTDALGNPAGDADGCAAHCEALAVMCNDGFGQGVEIAQDVGPLGLNPGMLHPSEEFVAQHQGEERAEHMAADGGIGFVEDRACIEQALGGPEDLFDCPELLVFQRDLGGGERGVGAQYPHSVEPLLLLSLFAVDGQDTLSGLEIALVSLVGDQAFGTAAQLALKRGKQFRPSGRILGACSRLRQTT